MRDEWLEQHMQDMREYEIEQKKFEEYFALFNQAKELEKTDIDAALEIYLRIVRDYKPIGVVYYERPAIILERLKRYDECIAFCQRYIKTLDSRETTIIADFRKRIERCRQKKAGTWRKGQSAPKASLSENTSGALALWQTGKDISEVQFPDWYISVTFGVSTSASFENAVTMARYAPIFIRGGTESKPLFQAVYGADPQEYLAFIALYEIVRDWKSSFVVINGQMIDRKIVGQLNYCYGDKCRSGNPDFCFGASEMTENPFGCHRLQISACNHPWYSFGKLSPYLDKVWLVDKEAIRARASSFAQVYSLCPCFDRERIDKTIRDLPDEIDLRKHTEYELTAEGLVKPYYVGSLNISVAEILSAQAQNRTQQPAMPTQNQPSAPLSASQHAPQAMPQKAQEGTAVTQEQVKKSMGCGAIAAAFAALFMMFTIAVSEGRGVFVILTLASLAVSIFFFHMVKKDKAAIALGVIAVLFLVFSVCCAMVSCLMGV